MKRENLSAIGGITAKEATQALVEFGEASKELDETSQLLTATMDTYKATWEESERIIRTLRIKSFPLGLYWRLYYWISDNIRKLRHEDHNRR